MDRGDTHCLTGASVLFARDFLRLPRRFRPRAVSPRTRRHRHQHHRRHPEYRRPRAGNHQDMAPAPSCVHGLLGRIRGNLLGQPSDIRPLLPASGRGLTGVERHADLTMLARLSQALGRARAVPLGALEALRRSLRSHRRQSTVGARSSRRCLPLRSGAPPSASRSASIPCRLSRICYSMASRYLLRRSFSQPQGLWTAWTSTTSCSTPGTFGFTFSSNHRSCCSWLSQISETVNTPLSTKATWYMKPGWVFSFSTSGGEISSYCDVVIPGVRWRMSTAMNAPSVGCRLHPDMYAQPVRQTAGRSCSQR